MPIYKIDGEKKDGLQKYRVRINYKDNLGEHKQTDRIAYGLDAAKLLERELAREIKQSAPAQKLTVQGLYDEYVEYQRNRIRESSLLKSMQILKTHVLPTMGKRQLKKLNLITLQEWKTEIEGKKYGKKQLPLSIAMKKNIFGGFNALLNYAVRFELLDKNPLRTIENFKDAYSSKKEVTFYTSDEFLKFILAAKEYVEGAGRDSLNAWGFYVFFNIAFYTGARKGEIHALKWSDMDSNILHIRRSISQKLKGGDRETPPKNKSSVRDVQIPAPLVTILKEHYARYSIVDGFSDDWRICGGIKPLRDTHINNLKIEFAKNAGLKQIRIHDFRHSHASLLANEGINIQEIARRLGHSKIEITWNTYAHLYPREEERAIAVLDKIV